MKKKISKAIVTGGAGFIGSHLVEALVSRGVETYVIDNLDTGSLSNVSHLLDDQKDTKEDNRGRLHVIIGDIRNIDKLLHHVTDVDIIFHQAAMANVKKSIDDPIAVNDVNVVCTLKVLNFALKMGVSKFLFASSAAVYGEIPDTLPSASEELCCAPMSPYGASKLASEAYLSAFEKSYGLKTTILRYANVYGPRQQSSSDYSGVITIFTNGILSCKTPVIYGDGLQVRDFIHVSDVVRANLIAAESDEASGETFNVGSGVSISINHLLAALSRLIFPNSEPLQARYLPPKTGDTRKGIMSIEKIKRKLGYSPSISIETGLSDVIRYYKLKNGVVENEEFPETFA